MRCGFELEEGVGSRLVGPEAWVPFMLEAFIPFCSYYFSNDQLWDWSTKKLALPQQQFYCAGSHTGQGKGGVVFTTPGTEVVGESGATSPKLRFCVSDAFDLVGIQKGTLDLTKIKKCGGASCKFYQDVCA